MACRYSPCCTCKNFVKTSAVALTGNVLTLTIPEGIYQNKQRVCICVSQALPSGLNGTQTVAILIGSNTTQYPLRSKSGNAIYADQIRSRKVYCTITATDIPSFTVQNTEAICPTTHVFNNIPTASVPTETAKGVK